MKREVKLAKRLLESVGYTVESTRKSAPPPSYYKVLKDTLKKLLGTNASIWSNITTRSTNFDANMVSLEVTRWKLSDSEYDELKSKVKSKEQDLKKSGITVNYEPTYSFIVSMSINRVEDIVNNQEPETPKEKSISYWAVDVGDGGRTNYYAVGAELPGDPKTNLDRVAEKLGQRKFTHYYSKGSKKRFRSYETLKKYLTLERVDRIPSEEELSRLANDESYTVLESM